MGRIRFVLLSFAIVLLYGCPAEIANNESLNKIKSLSIKGIVIAKIDLKAQPCFGSIVIKSNNKLDTIYTCHCSQGSEMWNYITIGDSILKPSGISRIEIHKSNSEARYFEYPHCYY